MKIRLCCALLVLGVSACCSQQLAFANRLLLTLKNGNVLMADVEPQTFAWVEVSKNGTLRTIDINSSEIASLSMLGTPESEKVANVRSLLAKLNDKEYAVREAAEKQLKEPDIGGPYRSIIQAHSELPHELDAQYRMKRILGALDQAQASVPSRLDKLVLKNGTTMLGDADQLQLRCSFRGQDLTFNRSELANISLPTPIATSAPQPSQPVVAELFHTHENDFFKELSKANRLDFNQGGQGEDLKVRADVTDRYLSRGVRFSATDPPNSYVGISGFGLERYSSIPCEGNSIAVIESNGKRFKGIMEFSFCVPGQPSIDAGVDAFGLFLGRSNHSRDFIIEAFNQDDQIIGTVESSSRRGVFFGIKTNEPIRRIKLMSNPYLAKVDRIVDEDYTVDDVCFSNPIALPGLAPSELIQVTTNSGEVLHARGISWPETDLCQLDIPNLKPVQLRRQDISSICFENREETSTDPEPQVWRAILTDRSIVKAKMGSSPTSELIGDLDINQVAGFASTRSAIRFPQVADFDSGKVVLAFPTCRLAVDEVAWNDDSLSWSEPRLLEADLQFEDFPEKEEDGNFDPNPDFSKIEFATKTASNLPTVWRQNPLTHRQGTGLVRLRDGQQFVTGSELNFKLGRLNENGAEVILADKPRLFAWSHVESIVFESDNSQLVE